MQCKGFCDVIPTYNRYTQDTRFCAICGKHLLIYNIGLRCPCCHSLFRTVPKAYRYSLLKERKLLHRY